MAIGSGLRTGSSSLYQLLKRQILIDCARPALLPALAATVGGNSPYLSTLVRITSVFTKNPISSSISDAIPVRDRRADDDVCLARVARQQRLEHGKQASMNKVTPFPLAQLLHCFRQTDSANH
jgi:hypothetical protein